MKKFLKIAGIIVIICVLITVFVFLMRRYDNPVSKLISKISVQNYIDTNYPSSDFVIEDVSCYTYPDGYRVLVKSSADPLTCFTVCTNWWGQIYEEYLPGNDEIISFCELEYFNCTYGALKEDNRTAEFIIEFSLCNDTQDTATVLKIGEVSLNTIKKATEDGKSVYTAVYESDIFNNMYDISKLTVEITVTNGGETKTLPIEADERNKLQNLLSDAFLQFLPPVSALCEENKISCEYDGELITVNGVLKFESDITDVSDIYIVTEINNEIAQIDKCSLSQTEYVICDEYNWKNADYVAIYAIFKDTERSYICKYELAHWLNGDMGWMSGDCVYDEDGNLLNEPYQSSADIRDFWEYAEQME